MIPLDTQGRFIVYKTSMRHRRRRINALQTLNRRRVSTGVTLELSSDGFAYLYQSRLYLLHLSQYLLFISLHLDIGY